MNYTNTAINRPLHSTTPEAIVRLTFHSAFDNLINHSYGPEMTIALERQLLNLGVDRHKLLPAYPNMVFDAVLRLLAEHCHPSLPLETAVEMIGTRAIEKHFNSLLGRPLFAFLRLLGPERTLMRMKQNLRSANNFCESELFVVAPEHFHLWFNDSTLVKHIRVGLMRRGLELLYSSSWSVNIISSDELGTVYEIKAH